MKEKTKVKIVNCITGSRVLGSILLPFIAPVLGTLSTAIFIGLLWLTDALDGYLAKHKWGVSTIFGANLDAFSDKLLGVAMMLYLIPFFPALILPVLSELAILRVNWYFGKKGADVKSSKLGKVKTAILDITTVLALLSTLSLTGPLSIIIPSLIAVTSAFQIGTLIDYTNKHKKYLKNNQPKNNVSNLSFFQTLKEIGRLLKDEKLYSPAYFKEHKKEALLDMLLDNKESEDVNQKKGINIEEKCNDDYEFSIIEKNELKILYNLNDNEISELEQFAKKHNMKLNKLMDYLEQYIDLEKLDKFPTFNQMKDYIYEESLDKTKNLKK